MPNYDYINARLRGMKRRLLDAGQRQTLSAQPDITGYLNVLGQTPYADAVEAARLDSAGLDAAMRALQRHFTRRIEKVRALFGGDETPVDVLLYRYDVQNVLAVLNGFANGAPRERIRQALLPLEAGVFEHAIRRAATWQEARDTLITLVDAPWRGALVGGDVPTIRRRLYDWYYGQQPAHEVVAEVLRRQADQHNIMTALRQHTHFAPVGHISQRTLQQAAATEGVSLAVEVLAKRPYRDPLRQGLNAYERTQRLSEFDEALTAQRHTWQTRHIRRDPLGVGVVVGYLAALHEEVQALRLIAQKKGLRV